MIACLPPVGLGISLKLKAMVSMRALCTNTTNVLFHLRRMAKPPVAREPNISRSGSSLYCCYKYHAMMMVELPKSTPWHLWFIG